MIEMLRRYRVLWVKCFWSKFFWSMGVLLMGVSYVCSVCADDVEPSRPQFSMAFSSNPEEEPILKFTQLFYMDALERLGYELKTEIIPPARIGYHVKRGEVDGDPARVWEYGDQFPELLRVNVPLVEVDVTAFSLGGKIRVAGLEQLALGDTRVDYILGARYSEATLIGLVPEKRL